jgi:hypothetical protein
MTSKRQLFFAYGLAIHLLFIGIICYAAFPQKVPDQPLRTVYHTAAGKVLFDHQTHISDQGYGLACADCHHHPSDEEESLVSCNYCHQKLPEDESYPESCLDCHDEDEIEGSEIINNVDAAHQQCIGCHEEFEADAVECSECHLS